MITVHHLENSRSQRILWLLEELGVDYEITKYKRHPETSLAPPELARLHPMGKAPVVTDGDITLAESAAIIEYLVDHYGEGRLRPAAGTAEARSYTYWLHFAEGTLMPLMLVSLIVGRIASAPMPFFAKPIAKGIANKVRNGYLDPNVMRSLDFMEMTLARSSWFCGSELTAADIQMSFPIEAAAVRSNLQDDYPKLNGYLERIHALPAYQRALQKGGPYELLGASTKK
jgi:glutathione S-transferase